MYSQDLCDPAGAHQYDRLQHGAASIPRHASLAAGWHRSVCGSPKRCKEQVRCLSLHTWLFEEEQACPTTLGVLLIHLEQGTVGRDLTLRMVCDWCGLTWLAKARGALLQKADDASIQPFLAHRPPLSQVYNSELLRSWLTYMKEGCKGAACSHVRLHEACEGMLAAIGPNLILLRPACTRTLSGGLTARLVHIKLTALQPFGTTWILC